MSGPHAGSRPRPSRSSMRLPPGVRSAGLPPCASILDLPALKVADVVVDEWDDTGLKESILKTAATQANLPVRTCPDLEVVLLSSRTKYAGLAC